MRGGGGVPWHDLRVVRPLALLAAVALVLAACNDDGRTLAPAPTVPEQRATTTTSAPPAPDVGVEDGLTLSSPAFTDGDFLDPSFTCDGIDVPPPLAISGIPPAAAELAIVVTDRDAAGFVHWAIAGLAPSITKLESGVVPPDAVTARNSSGVEGWSGPCPPGDEPHAYEFVVYAVAEPLGLTPGLDGRQAIDLIQQAAIASDVLVVFYGSSAG